MLSIFALPLNPQRSGTNNVSTCPAPMGYGLVPKALHRPWPSSSPTDRSIPSGCQIRSPHGADRINQVPEGGSGLCHRGPTRIGGPPWLNSTSPMDKTTPPCDLRVKSKGTLSFSHRALTTILTPGRCYFGPTYGIAFGGRLQRHEQCSAGKCQAIAMCQVLMLYLVKELMHEVSIADNSAILGPHSIVLVVGPSVQPSTGRPSVLEGTAGLPFLEDCAVSVVEVQLVLAEVLAVIDHRWLVTKLLKSNGDSNLVQHFFSQSTTVITCQPHLGAHQLSRNAARDGALLHSAYIGVVTFLDHLESTFLLGPTPRFSARGT